MAVDIACRTALAQRGVSHLTIPIDIQEKKLNGKYSRHNVGYHTSDVYSAETIPSSSLIGKAAQILNTGNRVVILVGQGALGVYTKL
jgi:pyruvate dehydrogenase (quinone)